MGNETTKQPRADKKKHVESKRVTDDEFPDHHHHQEEEAIHQELVPTHHQLATKITIPFIISSFMTIVVQYHRIVCFLPPHQTSCPPLGGGDRRHAKGGGRVSCGISHMS